MKDQVGQTAGKIWKALGQKGEVNVAMLPRMVKEKNDVAYQALGWLAHEGKIIYNKKENKNFVALSESERKIFKTIH
jgi:hypothetical protein